MPTTGPTDPPEYPMLYAVPALLFGGGYIAAASTGMAGLVQAGYLVSSVLCISTSPKPLPRSQISILKRITHLKAPYLVLHHRRPLGKATFSAFWASVPVFSHPCSLLDSPRRFWPSSPEWRVLAVSLVLSLVGASRRQNCRRWSLRSIQSSVSLLS